MRGGVGKFGPLCICQSSTRIMFYSERHSACRPTVAVRWYCDVSYTSVVLWVETIHIPRAGRRAELTYVATGIISICRWTWKLNSNKVAYNLRFVVMVQWLDAWILSLDQSTLNFLSTATRTCLQSRRHKPRLRRRPPSCAIRIAITSAPVGEAKYCDDRVCLSVCPRAYPRNCMSDLRQFFKNVYCLRPWLGPRLTALRYVV